MGVSARRSGHRQGGELRSRGRGLFSPNGACRPLHALSARSPQSCTWFWLTVQGLLAPPRGYSVPDSDKANLLQTSASCTLTAESWSMGVGVSICSPPCLRAPDVWGFRVSLMERHRWHLMSKVSLLPGMLKHSPFRTSHPLWWNRAWEALLTHAGSAGVLAPSSRHYLCPVTQVFAQSPPK